MQYRSDIDGLRAIAILSVVGFHAYPNLFRGGFIGVDVFFVISGYLITTIILNELANDSFTLKDFYIRRIRRIFPALLLVLFCCLLFGWFSLLADEYRQLGKHIFNGATFVSNFVFWKESGYFDIASEKKVLLHLWSLAIEEQYYLIWPMLALILWKKKINFLKCTLSIALISFLFNILSLNHNISAAFFLPSSRFWELMIGSIAAYLVMNRETLLDIYSLWSKNFLAGALNQNQILNIKLNKNILESIPFIGGILIIGSIFFITKDMKFPGWCALFPVIGATLVILSPKESWLNRAILSHPILVWIGLISFPLYLWHWPILSFARILEGKELSLWVRSLCICLSFICAAATYYLLEKPIRASKNKFKILIMLVLMIIMGAVGFLIYKENGLVFRLQNNEILLKQFDWNSSYNKSEECKKKFPGDDYCNISNPNISPNVAIIGDSHANHFYWGLSEYFKSKNKNLINMGSGGCPPFIGISMSGPGTSANCYSRMLPIFDFILNSKSIDTVYIGFWHSAYFDNRLIYSDNLGKIKTKDNYEYVLKALDRTIVMLREHGKRVIIIYDLPDLKQNIKDCFLKRPIYSKKECILDESIFIDDFNEYDRLIKDLTLKNNVEIFDTHKYLKGNFPVDIFGVPTYRDYSHLSINGSLFFRDKFDQ
jgi:peptidoglycan/LPS O-acetylase OafA/YrhL